MTYKVILKPHAEKQFARLPKDIQKRVRRQLSWPDDDNYLGRL